MRTIGIALALVGILVPATLDAQTLRYQGSLSVSSGTYIFAERTTTWSLLTGVTVESGGFSVNVGLPLYVQNTRLISGTATGLLPSGGPVAGAVADSVRARGERGRSPGSGPGSSPAIIADPVETPVAAVTGYEAHMGDPTFGVSYSRSLSTRVLVSLSGNVKAPVTDTSSYGTGAWDFGTGASVSLMSKRRLFLSGSASYWTLGDLPDLELRDVWFGGLSFGILRPGGWSVAGLLSAASSVIAEFDPPISLGVSVSRFGGLGSIGLACTVGLTETAQDVSVSGSWGLDLLRGS